MEHFLLRGGGVAAWPVQILARAMSPEQVLSAETSSSHQNATSAGLDEDRGVTVIEHRLTR